MCKCVCVCVPAMYDLLMCAFMEWCTYSYVLCIGTYVNTYLPCVCTCVSLYTCEGVNLSCMCMHVHLCELVCVKVCTCGVCG